MTKLVERQTDKVKVLVLCHDTIGKKMAGPGIRYLHVADQLKKVADVTLSVFSDSEDLSSGAGIKSISKLGDSYKSIFDEHDIVFAQWLSGDMLQYAKLTDKKVIFDLYAPVPIEYLASIEFSATKTTPDQDIEFSGILETYSNYLALGDYFVCSNERQRDFWIGYMIALGLVKPANFIRDDLMKRFAISPMGISSTPPNKTNLKLRSSLGLKASDKVLLWTGGIWDWFDAQVIIKAVDLLNDPKLKLVFLGTKHPNSAYKEEMSESIAARKLADKLSMTNKTVFFLDGWVPYDERAAYLLDADVAIYADKESLETRYSHRTRVLDHIWTELPTICNSGDYLAETIERYGFGVTVPDRAPEKFAKAIHELTTDQKLLSTVKSNLQKNKSLFTWEKSLAPLITYVANAQKQPVPKIVPSKSPTSPKLKLTRRIKRAAKVIIKGY